MSDNSDRQFPSSLRAVYNNIDADTIDKWESYIELYQDLFLPIRSKIGSVLEIGVFRGGSLRMWKNFFGDNATIVGIDINERAKHHEVEGVNIEIGDQSDPNFLAQIIKRYGNFDVVIDDGGHYWAQQSASFDALYEATNYLYIVEDVHTSLWSQFSGGADSSFLEKSKRKIDLLYEYFAIVGSSEGFYDGPPLVNVGTFRQTTKSIEFFDSLIVFKKAKNAPPKRRRIKFDADF